MQQKSTFFFQRIWPALFLLIGGALLTYTSLRAYGLSMTHDESSTFLNGIDQPLWRCFFSPECWGTANMHLTNTFLMQLSVGIFGISGWAVRLPNLLGHLVYLIFSYRLVRSLTDDKPLQLGSFVLLSFHPYLLEFFAVSRGYGLACSGLMVTFYYLLRYQAEGQKKYAWYYSLGLAFAVMSNFTFLLLYAAVGGALMLGIGFREKSLQAIWQEKAQFYPWLTVGVGLALLLYKPLSFLRAGGEFSYGTDTLWESYQFFIMDTIQGEGYFGAVNREVFMGIGLALMLGAGWLVIQHRDRIFQGTSGRFFAIGLLVTGLIVLMMVLQYYLLGTKYLRNRTAIMFVPLGALCYSLFLMQWGRIQRLAAQITIGVLAAFAAFHLLRAGNQESVREWAYDAQTHAMIQYMTEKEAAEPIRLGMHWYFTHASNFYVQAEEIEKLEPIIYEKELRVNDYYHYYYVRPEDVGTLAEFYEVERAFGRVGVLLRKKLATNARIKD
ncbi:MAG: glycosyltransferase family 39 protein [Bacteroidota bacterium]